MSIEGQGHFFTIYFPGFVCFVLYKATISGERLQDHWSSGFSVSMEIFGKNFTEMFIEWSSTFHMPFVQIGVFDWLSGAKKGQFL